MKEFFRELIINNPQPNTFNWVTFLLYFLIFIVIIAGIVMGVIIIFSILYLICYFSLDIKWMEFKWKMQGFFERIIKRRIK